MGLLSKANLLDLSEGLAFSNFIQKYNINFFAIFELINDKFQITNSLGFDSSSIINSSSSVDFWNGILKETGKVYSYYTNNENPLLQFFSFKIKDNIKNISVVKINESKILLICNSNIDDKLISDFNKVDYTLNKINIEKLNSYITKDSFLYKIQIDFQEAIESLLLSKKIKDENQNAFYSKVIFNELSNRIFYLFNYPNTTVLDNDFSIKTIFICNSKTSKDLLINHLILNYKEVIDTAAEIINFNFEGNAETFNDVKEFLQVE